VRLLYPPYCHLCERPIQGDRYLCENCFKGLARVSEPYCMRCGETYDGLIDVNVICSNCSSRVLHFDFARASLVSSESATVLVHGLKYQKQRHLARALASCMFEAVEIDERFARIEKWCLVPVPLHWKREWKRGFNQALEISEELSKLTGYPVVQAIHRVRDTPTQTRLSRVKRLENLKDAFTLVVNPRFEGVILIDDVFTTGATVNACAAVLREIFPSENIVVLTAMRG